MRIFTKLVNPLKALVCVALTSFLSFITMIVLVYPIALVCDSCYVLTMINSVCGIITWGFIFIIYFYITGEWLYNKKYGN